jgi:asparagine synthase (glutamine-hydrolysing)
MCGILGLFGVKGDLTSIRKDAMQRSKRLRHRGPDASGIEIRQSQDGTTYNVLCQERLAIVDPLATK